MNKSESGRLGFKASNLLGYVKERALERRAAYKPKSCPGCGDPIPYEKRRHSHCCHSCAAVTRNKERLRSKKNPVCLNCGSEDKGYASKFCSQSCHVEYYQKENLRKWLAGEVLGHNANGNVCRWVREWLIKQRGERCEQCGWKKRNPVTTRVPLHAHHKDGDSRKTRPENLELLCPNCHSLTPTYRILNKGRGTRTKYQKVSGRSL